MPHFRPVIIIKHLPAGFEIETEYEKLQKKYGPDAISLHAEYSYNGEIGHAIEWDYLEKLDKDTENEGYNYLMNSNNRT